MYVWLNGQFIGYGEDSFTPSDFDLTPYIREKGNVLAVEVHKRSSAAYLEDQDFFRFSGIFRNVTLYAKPQIHVEDLWARTKLKEDGKSGELALRLRLSEAGEHTGGESIQVYKVSVLLKDKKSGNALFEKILPAAETVQMEP